MLAQVVPLANDLRYDAGMPTRRIFYMTVMVAVLVHPAVRTVKFWGRRQLAMGAPGSIRHGVGEVLVTIL